MIEENMVKEGDIYEILLKEISIKASIPTNLFLRRRRNSKGYLECILQRPFSEG